MTRRTKAELEQALGRAQAALLKLASNHMHVGPPVDEKGEDIEDWPECLFCEVVSEGLSE
jgi:hypothetical protein